MARRPYGIRHRASRVVLRYFAHYPRFFAEGKQPKARQRILDEVEPDRVEKAFVSRAYLFIRQLPHGSSGGRLRHGVYGRDSGRFTRFGEVDMEYAAGGRADAVARLADARRAAWSQPDQHAPRGESRGCEAAEPRAERSGRRGRCAAGRARDGATDTVDERGAQDGATRAQDGATATVDERGATRLGAQDGAMRAQDGAPACRAAPDRAVHGACAQDGATRTARAALA